MKLIELHILQSFPVTCLNRDDLGSPKSALFGGASRARISSQCLQRASRQRAAELQPNLMAGKRSRRFVAEIENALSNEPHNLLPDRASALAQCAGLPPRQTGRTPRTAGRPRPRRSGQ